MVKFKDRDKGSYPEIYDELWDLRKRSDGISAAFMSGFPVLTRILGRGDAHQAVGRFFDDMARYALSEDRTERAFSWSVTGTDNVLERMQFAGEKLHVGERRARDLSDEGLLKYSQEVGSLAFNFHPIVTVLVVTDEESVHFTTLVYIEPKGEYYRSPLFKLDGEDIEPQIASTETVAADGHVFDVHTYETITQPLERDPGWEVRMAVWRPSSPDVRLASDVVSGNSDFTCITLVQSGIINVRVCPVSGRSVP